MLGNVIVLGRVRNGLAIATAVDSSVYVGGMFGDRVLSHSLPVLGGVSFFCTGYPCT